MISGITDSQEFNINGTAIGRIKKLVLKLVAKRDSRTVRIGNVIL